MGSIGVYIIYIITAFIISILLFRSYKKEDNPLLWNFSIFFLLFAFYRFFLIFPLIANSMKIINISYNTAILFYFSMGGMAIKIVTSFLDLKEKTTNILITLNLSIGGSIILYQLTNTDAFRVLSSGVVIWGENSIPLYITGVSGFIVASFWMYAFYIGAKNRQRMINKIKNILIVIGAFFGGMSSVVHFTADEKLISLAFIFYFLAIISILSVWVLSYIKKY